MKNNNSQATIAEVKPRKVIGWATFINQLKLEALRPDWKDLFDLQKISLRDRFKILTELGVVEKQLQFENMTPLVGFEALVKAMTGNIASVDEIAVNVHALGSDNTEASDSDTELGNETTRALLASRAYGTGSNRNKAYYTAFYGLSDAVGTHEEMGLFINADDGTPDDGVLWDRTLLTIVKSGSQSLTIDYEDSFIND